LTENGGEFSEHSPDDLVRFQQNALNSEQFKILDLLQDYVSQLEGRIGYKQKVKTTLRSFFLHNRAELPRDPSFIVRSEKQRVIGNLTIEEVRDMVLSSKPAYQAIFLSMLQGGMGVAEFEHWNLNGYENLMKQLKNDSDVIEINLHGRKRARNVRPYNSFIGGDAINAIKKWLLHRPKNAEAIFTNQYGKPITVGAVQLYWLRHLRKLGLISKPKENDVSHRTGKNIHKLRDVFCSQWEKSPAKVSVAEYLMGHQVNPLEYNKAFKDSKWTRREYLKALPMLQIISSGRPFGQIEESELEALRRENEILRAELDKRGDALTRVEETLQRVIERLDKLEIEKK